MSLRLDELWTVELRERLKSERTVKKHRLQIF